MRLSKRYTVLWFTFSLLLYWISISLPALGRKHFRYELSKAGQFALYSYSFGNYRNELHGIQDILLSFNKYGIDSYFFTDRRIPPVNGWEIIVIDTNKEFANSTNPNRSAGKKLKFQFHPKLKKYRYLIHTDARDARLVQMRKWLSNGLVYFVLDNPQYALFVGEHPDRKNIEEEVNVLFGLGSIQPQAELENWKKFLSDEFVTLNKVRLPELCTWILDTHHRDFVDHWSRIYDLLNEHGLWRDQIVFSYALVTQALKIKYIGVNATHHSAWED